MNLTDLSIFLAGHWMRIEMLFCVMFTYWDKSKQSDVAPQIPGRISLNSKWCSHTNNQVH